MPKKEHERSSVISVRLPDDLLQRLDHYLDWCETQRGAKSSRNAALRDALSLWLNDQEQYAGLSTAKTLHEQFQNAYNSVRHSHAGAHIYRLRDALGWPRERFDAVLEQ